MFENEYTMNRKLTQEYVLNILCKKMAIIGICTFIGGTALYLLERNGFGYVMLTCAILSLILIIILPFVLINTIEKDSKRFNNGNIEKTCITFNDKIVMNEGNVHLEFEYSQIKKIMQTKNFIVLKTGEWTAILVYKLGFVKGSEGEFTKFINSKMPNRDVL